MQKYNFEFQGQNLITLQKVVFKVKNQTMFKVIEKQPFLCENLLLMSFRIWSNHATSLLY